jgi:hypothetical protein
VNEHKKTIAAGVVTLCLTVLIAAAKSYVDVESLKTKVDLHIDSMKEIRDDIREIKKDIKQILRSN